MSIRIDCHGESHVGRRRPANEDQFLIADLNKSMRVHQTSLGLNHQTRLFGGSQGKLLLVADGLGGHESGERASTLAVDGVTNYILNTMDWFFQLNKQNEAEFEAGLREALQHSQQVVNREADAIPQRHNMATTLTMTYIDWPELYVVHVGDTRCYHFRDAAIRRLTTDHTVAELAKQPQSTESVTAGDGRDNIRESDSRGQALWNVIGGPDLSLEPQTSHSQLKLGDALQLCSDGLPRHVEDNEILELVTDDNLGSKQICEKLIRIANDRGGEDNITVVLARFMELGSEVHIDAEVVESDHDGAVDLNDTTPLVATPKT